MKINKIKQLAEAAFNSVLADRRHLHKNPELSFKEFQTQQFVWERLDEMGITNKVKIAETGIVAMIEGKNPSAKIIALRADMDALPIQETNKTDYVSQNAGVMHACGHDVHTSSLLGVASVLQQFKNEFSGTVKLLFQPGEEKLPGGASMMIKEGVLKIGSVSPSGHVAVPICLIILAFLSFTNLTKEEQNHA